MRSGRLPLREDPSRLLALADPRERFRREHAELGHASGTADRFCARTRRSELLEHVRGGSRPLEPRMARGEILVKRNPLMLVRLGGRFPLETPQSIARALS